MNGPIKRLLLSLALSLPAATSMAQGLSAGVFLGSPMSGVTVSQYDLRLSIGVKDLGVAWTGFGILGSGWPGRI